MTDDPGAAFTAAAEPYAVYRPEYDRRAFDYLREQFDLDGTGRLLDLGCGTGRLGVTLADDFDHVLGIDPNKRMLSFARERARVANVENAEWRRGSDADLPDVAAEFAPLRLTTIGRAFHRMDQDRTLDRLHELTEPGGGVALLNDSEWVARGTAEWQDAVYEVLTIYLDDPPERTGPVEYDDSWVDTLENNRFENVEERLFEVEREWDDDSVVGYLRSLSFCSPAVLGDDEAAFEQDVRDALSDYEEPYEENAIATVISGTK